MRKITALSYENIQSDTQHAKDTFQVTSSRLHDTHSRVKITGVGVLVTEKEVQVAMVAMATL